MSEVGREQRRRNRLRHGLYTMQKAVAVLGSRALPSKSTALGRELRAWRDSIIADLGGTDAVSAMQLALVEKATTQKLVCDSLDAYVLQMASLVNKRHRTLWPVVRERVAQVALLQSLLRDLGLERRAKPVPSLSEYLAAHSAKAQQQASPTTATDRAEDGATAPLTPAGDRDGQSGTQDGDDEP